MHKNKKENLGVVVSFLIVIIFILGVIYFVMNKPEKVDPLEGINISDGQIDTSKINIPNEGEGMQSNNQNMDSNNRVLGDFTPLEKVNNLEKIDLVIGTGEEVKSGATVSVHYTGAVASNGAVFQSSKDFGTDPVTFPLSNVIKGWTDGIPGMKVGGVRRLLIPSYMAYGANPPAGSGIPANADLVFDVELVAVQ